MSTVANFPEMICIYASSDFVLPNKRFPRARFLALDDDGNIWGSGWTEDACDLNVRAKFKKDGLAREVTIHPVSGILRSSRRKS